MTIAGIVTLLASPHVLGGLLVLGVLAQIVLAIRQGEAGVWAARRWTLWAIAIHCSVILLLLDAAEFVTGEPARVLFNSMRGNNLIQPLLAYLGASLVTLTVVGGIIARIATRLRSPPAPDRP